MREMTVWEFSKLIKRTRITVYNWVKKKQLPSGVTSKVVHGHLIIVLDENFRNE